MMKPKARCQVHGDRLASECQNSFMDANAMDNQTVRAYLFFDGRCEEALEFYKQTLGAEVNFMLRAKDSPVPPEPGSFQDGNKIMHVQFRIRESVILASDGRCGGKPEFKGFSLALTAQNEAEADKFFNGLAQGGKIQMPLTKTFFSPRFGMVEDKFGVGWMVLTRRD